MDLLTVYQYGSCSLGSDANRTNTHCSLADALVLTSRGSLLMLPWGNGSDCQAVVPFRYQLSRYLQP